MGLRREDTFGERAKEPGCLFRANRTFVALNRKSENKKVF